MVKWKEGEELWIPIKDAKESFPIEISSYAKEKDTDYEATFC